MAIIHSLVQRTTGVVFTSKRCAKLFVTNATQPTDAPGKLLLICDKHLYPELSYDPAWGASAIPSECSLMIQSESLSVNTKTDVFRRSTHSSIV